MENKFIIFGLIVLFILDSTKTDIFTKKDDIKYKIDVFYSSGYIKMIFILLIEMMVINVSFYHILIRELSFEEALTRFIVR